MNPLQWLLCQVLLRLARLIEQEETHKHVKK
jgi:hypothetical protein